MTSTVSFEWFDFLFFAVPDLFADTGSDRLWRVPNDDQRLENGCAHHLWHSVLDYRPFCQRLPFRSRRQFTPPAKRVRPPPFTQKQP